MNPLESIENWFDKADKSIKGDMAALVALFHPDSRLKHEIDEDNRITIFKEYLEPTYLAREEVMKRVFFLKSLINFGLSSRDTEEGWETARKRNEQIEEKWVAEGNKPGTYANFMKDYPERKAKWIAWANEWKTLLQTSLSDERLSFWFFIDSK